MKSLYTSLVAMLALFVFASVAVADPGTRWDMKIPGAWRFRVLILFNGEAVLDKETGRVWEQSPNGVDSRPWLDAQFHCNQKTVGNRKGWRLPTIQELASLVQPGDPPGGPDLPPGHPFDNVQSSDYWSATTFSANTSNAWGVGFGNGFVFTSGKTHGSLFVWCVRGGQGVDPQ